MKESPYKCVFPNMTPFQQYRSSPARNKGHFSKSTELQAVSSGMSLKVAEIVADVVPVHCLGPRNLQIDH
jgi:hypothetical protein